MRQLFRRFVAEQSGATAIEYGLVASLVSVVIIGPLTMIGLNLRDKGMEIADAIENAGR
jgi:pilus assembly protein Flp/PilA